MAITTGATILPKTSPNLTQAKFNGLKNLELINPSIKKNMPINNDQVLISPELKVGQIAIRVKITKNNIPKLLFELFIFFLVILFFNIL